MGSQIDSAKTVEEQVIWYGLVGTYLWYALGALYLVGPVLGWLLGSLLVLHLGRGGTLNTASWIWLLAMGVMLLVLLIGHWDWHLGFRKILKSSFGWAKGWALLALFIAAGCLPIRVEIVTRAAMWVCLQTLVLAPVFVMAWVIGLPQILYTSPLQVLGGAEFFSVSLYEIDPGSGLPRWRLFTPWAPALGFMANVFFLLSFFERQLSWRVIGVSASVLMILMSQSRLAMVVFILLAMAPLGFRLLHPTKMWLAIVFTSITASLFGGPITQGFEELVEQFKNARAGSTRVRSILARVAIHRWQHEAPWFGHGIVERGPHLVEYMPIGSHHSWYGLLFVKGAVGFLALAIPLATSACIFIFNLKRPSAQRGLCFVAILFLYTFGENLEILAYLIWPGLLVMGIAHRELARTNPQEKFEVSHD